MTDTSPSAAELCDEVARMAPERLREAVQAGGMPVHPWRAELDTPGRLAAAWSVVADLRRAHGDRLWWWANARGRRTAPVKIAALQMRALAQAWARLGGGRELLFHVRRVEHRAQDLSVSWARLMVPRIAIDPNPNVPVAPCLEHPITLDEAARFAIVLPLLRGCTALGEAATRALDAIGQPTTALQRWAAAQREPPRRRPVWRLPNVARSERPGLRMVTLTAAQVLADADGRTTPDHFGLAALMQHPSTWSRSEAVVLGALAWRLACERDARVQRDSRLGSHTLNLHPAVVGRRYRELEDPFAPLLAILRLGCRLYACSPEAMTFELRP